jgi:asparagine synthase (glutamine-hydrolysing)
MCGIAALFRFGHREISHDAIVQMTRAVAHRGPDGEGTAFLGLTATGLAEIDPRTGHDWRVALGHRRLSILDLSAAGRQPMVYRDHLWLIYNGEVYNYVELREELERAGHEFHSRTDSEVILAAYDQWGGECFERFRGMWGLVIIDCRRQVAIVSRDRLGIKPLYLVESDGLIAVASELKQFLSVPGLQLRPDKSVLRDYLLTGYERSRQTFFEGIAPVPAGVWLSIDLTDGTVSAPHEYWFPERIEATVTDSRQAGEQLRESLLEAVRIHLRSDVPVGCALSGGVDSSSIAGCVGQLTASRQCLETFSVLFPGTPIDESGFVKQMIESVHCRPHSITPTAEQFLADLDRFLWINDEPVGTVAQYAGYALARLTREAGVPVTLNGQGGDEVLGGYWQSYFLHLRQLWHSGKWLRLAGHFAGSMSPWGNRELPRQAPLMLRRYRARRGDGQQQSPLSSTPTNGAEDRSAQAKLARLLSMNDQQRRVFEIREMFLPRLLKWDDRNFMAFSVEGRYPLLDHRLIELALTFRPEALYSSGWTKTPLRRAMQGIVPQPVLWRRTKFGFETPQDAWLCGPLRTCLEAWLAGDAPIWEHFDRGEARRLADEVWQLRGRRDEPGQALMRLYLADRWLRLFFAETGRQSLVGASAGIGGN